MSRVKPSNYIIGIILFTMIILGGIAMIDIFLDENPTMIAAEDYEEFNATFNTYNDVQDEVGELQGNIEDADTDFGLFGVLNSLISSAWQSLRLLFSSFGFMNGVFIGMASMFGLPVWVPTLIILLITVVIAFAIYSAIFQRDI